jgi:drug/metabolite transporter (DMT)-like permease
VTDAAPLVTGRERRQAILWIALANVIGGASYPAQKAALAGLPPATITCLRNGIAFVALLWIVRRSLDELRRWSRADLGRALLVGTLAFALPMWLGIVGVERSTAANASILVLLEPVTIVALSTAFLGERIGPAKAAGLALGLGGAACIVFEGASLGDLVSGTHFQGNLLLALHGILWGLHSPLAKSLVERRDPLLVTLIVLACGTLALVPAALLEAPHWHAGPDLAPALAWTVGLGLVVSLASILLWLAALRRIPATSVAGFVFLQPLTGVLAGVCLLDERLTSAGIVGGALIVLGVALDVLATTRAKRG